MREKIVLFKDGRTHATRIASAPGGVARNMCEALRKLNHNPIFLSAIGDDLFGRELLLQFELMKIDYSKIMRSKQFSSAIYSALLNYSGECEFGMGDMAIHDCIVSDYILQYSALIQTAPIVVLDANIPVDTISTILKICMASNTPVWFEPTEIRKSQKICMKPTDYQSAVTFMSPNIRELQSILKAAQNNRGNNVDNFNMLWTFKDSNPSNYLKGSSVELEVLTECFHVFPGLEMVLLTKGREGILVTYKDKTEGCLQSFSYPAPNLPAGDIISVSGAGDCLNAGFISSILQGYSWMDCARIGTDCAMQSLKSHKNVPDAFIFTTSN